MLQGREEAMRAVLLDGFGGTEVLRLGERPRPSPQEGQLLVRVRCTALNRADVMQRRGHYPPPPGESEVLGLELAGDVVSVGEGVSETQWQGRRVFGLVGGGAYAEYALLHQQLAILIPEDWSYEKAAAIAEVFLTADETLFTLGGLRAGESVLIHAAASGVGSAAVQMARQAGATVFGTAGSAEKIELLRRLGVHAAIPYREVDFAARIAELTANQGVDLIADFIGGAYLSRNLASLNHGGRLLIIALLDGAQATLDLRVVLRKRLQIIGSVLRTRSLADKTRITQNFRQRWLPLLVQGKIAPQIDSIYPIEQVRQAHDRMEANLNCGKILLTL